MCVYDESGKPLKSRIDSSEEDENDDEDEEVIEEPPKKKVNLRAKSKGQPKPEPEEEIEKDDESETEKDESGSDTVPVSYHFVSHVAGVIFITLGDHSQICMYFTLLFHYIGKLQFQSRHPMKNVSLQRLVAHIDDVVLNLIIIHLDFSFPIHDKNLGRWCS